MIKVIYDNIIFNLQKSGGISVYWKELIERIILDIKVDFTMLEYKNADENIFRKQINIEESNIGLLRSFPSIKLLRYFNLRNKNTEKTIFHSSYYRTMKGKHIINVVTVHDFTYEKKINTLTGKIHIYQKKNALINADAIICISENTKKDMLEFYPNLKNKKIKVIYNGFTSEDFFQISDIKYENSVLFVGARKGYKNFNETVEIISKLDDVHLNIVGPPLDSKEKEFLNDKLLNRYIFHEHIINEELNILYNKSICLMYLSEYEGFGIPVLEAMSAGCPVIALRKSSIPEVAGDAGILFEKIDHTLIIETIIKLKDNRHFREKQIRLGINNSKRFSWEKCFNEVRDFYCELVND